MREDGPFWFGLRKDLLLDCGFFGGSDEVRDVVDARGQGGKGAG